METNKKRGSVNTVLSEYSIPCIEDVVHWFWDDTSLLYEFSLKIMELMRIYAVYYKGKEINEAWFSLESMIKFTSETIQLYERMRNIVENEEPWNWVNVSEGWVIKDC